MALGSAGADVHYRADQGGKLGRTPRGDALDRDGARRVADSRRGPTVIGENDYFDSPPLVHTAGNGSLLHARDGRNVRASATLGLLPDLRPDQRNEQSHPRLYLGCERPPRLRTTR